MSYQAVGDTQIRCSDTFEYAKNKAGQTACIDRTINQVVKKDYCDGQCKPSGFLESVLMGAKVVYGPGGVPINQQSGQYQAGMPDWLLPVALGGGALILVLVLVKKK